MNRDEARKLLDETLIEVSSQTYAELVAKIGDLECFERDGPSGRRYQVEVEYRWDGRPGECVRVLAGVDDGTLPGSIVPVCGDFLAEPASPLIPDELRTWFHDAVLVLHGYDAASRTLSIRIEKEIGGEVGILAFEGVSFVSLAESFSGDAIRATSVNEDEEGLWRGHSLCTDSLDRDANAFQIDDQDGPVHLIVARSVSYRVLSG